MRSAWLTTQVRTASQPSKRRWECPNCSGDCYGSSDETYYCHGKSMGTQTEQVGACGYWESWDGTRNGVNR